jgi:hypothetical protein
MEEIVYVLNDRVGNVVNDVKTYLHVRIHHTHEQHGLGGGNITGAAILFNAINLLSKVNYFIDKPECFADEDLKQKVKQQKRDTLALIEDRDSRKLVEKYLREPRINETNETEAFIYFVHCLHESGIDLGVPSDNREVIQRVWNGFRNKLAHISSVEDGKQAITFTFKGNGARDVDEFIAKIRQTYKPLESADNTRNWLVNVDVLASYMPDILKFTTEKLARADLSNESKERLAKIIK